MSTKINGTTVVQFTSKLTRNAKLICNQKTYELEKDLVIKKTNRKNVKIWNFNTCYDIKFKGERIGLFYAISNPWKPLGKDVNCMFQFDKNAFGNKELRVILMKLFAKGTGQVEIGTVREIDLEHENDGLVNFIIHSSSSMNTNILDNVGCRLDELKETLLSNRFHTGDESVRDISMQISALIETYKPYGMNEWLNEEIRNISMVDLNYLIAMTR